MLPKLDPFEVPREARHLAPRLTDLDVDAAGHVLAGAAEIALLPSQALLQPAETIVQSQERLARIVHLRHLRRQAPA